MIATQTEVKTLVAEVTFISSDINKVHVVEMLESVVVCIGSSIASFMCFVEQVTGNAENMNPKVTKTCHTSFHSCHHRVDSGPHTSFNQSY